MTTPITKEQELRAFITGFLTDPAHDEHSENSMTAQVFRIALAAIDAEPVAYMWDSDRKDVDAAGYYRPEHKILAESSVKRYGGKVVPLYAAPPVSVVNAEAVADVVAWHKEGEEPTCDIRWRRFYVAPGPLFAVAQPVAVVPDEMAISDDMNLYQKSFAQGHNACRAAMLNHSEVDRDMVEPVSQSYKLPATRFQQVADLYGITSPTGSETSFTFDAFEASSFAKSGWAVQEYVELERYQEAVAGNSPVIPDGWQFVPVEPTKEMIDAGWLHFMGTKNPSSKGTYKAMLAAAPQQEVK